MSQQGTRQPRILAAEDSPTQAELLVGHLRDAGFDVTHAPSGEAALECFTAQSFDLVLSDVVMPGIDGYELCQRVKEHERDVPVVMLTSLTDPLEIVRSLEAGADNFLRKPYDAEQLISRLRTMLYHREMRASGRANIGLEVMLRDKRFLITSERQQILDLLMSSFEDLVTANGGLREREEALTAAQTGLRQQLAATERERRRVAAVLQAVPDPTVIVDGSGIVTDISDAMCRLLATEASTIIGQPVFDAVPLVDHSGASLSDRRPLAATLSGAADTAVLGKDFDVFVRNAEGSMIPVIARAAAVRDDRGTVVAAVTTLHEIGALAGHDPVTKLITQAAFADDVGRALDVCRDEGCSVAVLALLVEPLGVIRQNVAPAAGDAFMAMVGDAVREVLAVVEGGHDGAGVAAYFGTDVFAIACPNLEDGLDAVRAAHTAREVFAGQRFTAAGIDVDLEVSIGVAVGNEEADADQMIAAAVAAARRASRNGDDRVLVTDPALDARSGEWLRQVDELRTAIGDGQLVVHYQPAMDLRRRRCDGVEALVRWRHPDGRLLLPRDFLPLAEESGLIVPLGWVVLREACRQVAEWRAVLPGADQLAVSVNIDARQLDDPSLVDRVSEALRDAALPPDALILEITESGMMQDAERALERLERLKRTGIRVAIDDFGVAYSSLAQLSRFPVDSLKIDRSFVSRMTTQPANAAIVAATVRLGRSLGLEMVAEGVESADELVQLRILGCDMAQGAHWTMPLGAEELVAWWANQGQEVADPGAADGPEHDEGDPDSDARVQDILRYLVHELSSPLTAIVGFTQLAAHDADPAQRQFLEAVVRNGESMAKRMRLLVDAQASFEGTLHLDPAPVDVADVVRTLVDDLRPQLEPHPLEVAAPPGGVVAEVDGPRLAQAVSNLLTNAAKFSPPDAPIEIDVVERAGDVHISVRDHGEGVPPERRTQLFRRFARLGSTKKGLGLGLYLVRTIAHAHGGDVRFEAPEDGGSRFVLTVPAGRTTQ